MLNSGISTYAVIEAKKGKEKISTGTFIINAFCCTGDGDMTIHYPSGDETISYVAGESRVLANLEVTIVSGSFTVN